MIAVRNWFPHGCAGPNGCDDPACHLCTVVANLEQPRSAMDALQKIDGANPERDGAPKLSGEKERGNLAFQKRRRVGPHR